MSPTNANFNRLALLTVVAVALMPRHMYIPKQYSKQTLRNISDYLNSRYSKKQAQTSFFSSHKIAQDAEKISIASQFQEFRVSYETLIVNQLFCLSVLIVFPCS